MTNDEPHSQSPSRTGSSGRFVPPTIDELNAALPSYEFVEMLGCGGMGAVFKALQPNLDRMVAIKILPLELGEEGLQFAERFKREAQALAKLNHPNIVSVFDFGQTDQKQLYFVMEFVEGTDLHQVIRSGQVGTEHVLGWIPQVCGALEYAHSKGIVHRDIKPTNILIDLEGTVKVADFGLAKLAGDDTDQPQLTMTDMAMGTPDYVAPETLELGVTPDHRADIYAIGVMLYEMLTGKVPRGAYRTPSEKVRGLDSRYDVLVAEAMDADRDTRIQQATEISSKLWEIGNQSAVEVPAVASAATRVKLLTGPGTTGRTSSLAAGAATAETEQAASGSTSTSSSKSMIIGVVIAVLLVGALLAFFLRGSGDSGDGSDGEWVADSASIGESSSGTVAPKSAGVVEPGAKPKGEGKGTPAHSPPKELPAVVVVNEVKVSLAREKLSGLQLGEQLATAKWTTPAQVDVKLGEEKDEFYSPALSRDSKHIFVSLWFGNDKIDVFQFSLTDDPLVIDSPLHLEAEVNGPNKDKSFSTAADEMIAAMAVGRKQGQSDRYQIKLFRRSADGSYVREAEEFNQPLASKGWNSEPTMTADGLTIVFETDRSGNWCALKRLLPRVEKLTQLLK